MSSRRIAMKEIRTQRRAQLSRGFARKQSSSVRSNLILARSLWGVLSRVAAERLRELTKRYGFSVAAGDLQLLNGAWYVTHAGLLSLSSRLECGGIRTTV